MPDTDQLAEAVDTAPPVTNDEGVAMHGEFPLNHRLRAEAMAQAGVTEDPDGLVTAELIAETSERIAAERRDAEEAKREAEANAPSLKWGRDELIAEAARLGAAHESDANKPAILAAINAAQAANKEA